MINNFNEWYIDVNIAPQEGQIEKRVEGIADYAQNVDKEDVCNLVNLYYGLPISEEDVDNFASAFIEKDPTFSARYRKELSLLAGATLLEISAQNTDYNSLAELLTITTSFYRKPSSTPRALNLIRKQFDNDRINIREKSASDGKFDFDQTKVNAHVAVINKTPWDTTLAKNLTGLLTEYAVYLDYLINRFDSLQEMQSIYKEDSQLLWWMMSDWSITLNQPLKEIDQIRGCLLVAYEAASFVSNYPGPYAMEGIIKRVTNACKGEKHSVEFTSLITEIAPQLKEIIKVKTKVFPAIKQLPITNAIICADNTADIQEWYPKYCRDASLKENIDKGTLENYAWQMYLECLALSYFEVLNT